MKIDLYSCDQCYYVTKKQHLLKTHKQLKHEGVGFLCDQCDYLAASMKVLKKHIDSLHSGIEYPCEIEQCDYVGKNPVALRNHKLRHKQKDEDRKFLCDQCDYAPASSGVLKQHIESMHSGIQYPCDLCDYVTNRPVQLKNHKLVHHDGVRYPCDKCEYRAVNVYRLKQHKESVHEGVRSEFHLMYHIC